MRKAIGRDYSDLPESYSIILNGAYCDNSNGDSYGLDYVCAIELSKDEATANYFGSNDSVEYISGGAFGVSLITSFNVDDGLARAQHSDPMIQVSSIESVQEVDYARKAIVVSIQTAAFAGFLGIAVIFLRPIFEGRNQHADNAE